MAMWTISFKKDPLDDTLLTSRIGSSNNGSNNGSNIDDTTIDLTKSESVIVNINTKIKDLLSSTLLFQNEEHNRESQIIEIIDAFQESGRIGRTTLAHLYSIAIADSCPYFSSSSSNDNNIHVDGSPQFVIEPLHFMRRWKKMQQIRARKLALMHSSHHPKDVGGKEGGNANKRTKIEIDTTPPIRNPSTYFPPYILERTDVWCDENNNITFHLAIMLEQVSTNCSSTCSSSTCSSIHEELTTTLKEFVMKFMDSITKSIIQNKVFLSHIANSVLQTKLRVQLSTLNAVAFIANDSIMPRKSGASFAPMSSPPAIPFIAPGNGSKLTKEVTIQMGKLAKYVNNKNVSRINDTDAYTIMGMIIPKGITLIVGGGYHGKSTMLRTIMAGVYDKMLGDGRELCVTDVGAITVRAEDGRYVNNTNVSSFISNLPIVGSDTKHFSTKEASGSTSQAANVVDAIEMGASALLVDEDVSAANFMSRDGRMRALVMDESITPLLYRVNGLYNEHGISSVLVVGGVGDWLDVPDSVIRLEKYVASDAYDKAKSISRQFSHGHVQYGGRGVVHRLEWDIRGTPLRRRPKNVEKLINIEDVRISLLDGGKLSLSEGSTPSANDEVLSYFGNDFLNVSLDEDFGTIDMTKCEQLLAGKYQLYGCAICALWLLKFSTQNPTLDLNQLLDKLESDLNGPATFEGILRSVSSSGKISESLLSTLGYAIRPRRYEVMMAVSRMRGIEFEELPQDAEILAKQTAKQREEEEAKRKLAELWANRRKK